MKLRHIEVFHAVYLTGSTSGAARALNVSQPTISKILKYSEDQLGFQLFDRTKGRLFPTEKGSKLFNEIEPIFGKINELKIFTQKLASSKKGRLRIATTPAFGVDIVPKALAAFSQLHTDITVEVETLHATEVIKALRDKTIDLGLVFDAPHAPGIVSKIIGKTEFICAAPADFNLPSKGALHLKDLKSFPLITLNEKSILGRLLAKQLSNAFNGPVDSRIIIETYHIAKRLVQEEAGVAIIDKVTAFSGDISNLQFREIALDLSVSIGLVTRINEPLSGFRKKFVGILSAEIERFLQNSAQSHL